MVSCRVVGGSVQAGLLMMPLESFELRDHHPAARDQHVAVLVGKGARSVGLGKARIGGGFLCRIVRSRDDQPVNHASGVLDAISWDTAAMSIPQEEAGGLRKQSRISGFGDGGTQQQDDGGRDGKSWTHGKPQIQYVPLDEKAGGAGSCRQQSSAKCRFAAFSACHFLDIYDGRSAQSPLGMQQH